MEQQSGWPELDDAIDQWTSATAALPAAFHAELRETLGAVERGELTLVWDTRDEQREALRNQFPHAFAGVYDRAMLYLALSLGLPGPTVRLLPVGGLVLGKNLGEQAEPGSQKQPADPAELSELRKLLAHVSTDTTR